MPKLVWVMGLKGPEPQLLRDDSVHGVRGDKGVYLQVHKISDTLAANSLDHLAKMFPLGGVDEK